MTARPIWFGPTERPLFGWFHLPGSGRAHGGVVLCPPIADEERRVYLTYRKLAESLTAAGFAVLRFCYDGTGDSAGVLEDPDRIDAWVASIGSAVALMRSSGAEHVTAVGMRLGATLATHAVDGSERSPDALVLWDPCATGREFLRYQQALMATLPGRPSTDEQGVDTPGYFIPAPLADELRRLEIQPIRSAATRAVVVARSDRPAPKRLEQALAGSSVDRLEAVGQEQLLDVPPLSATIPWRTIEQITAWVTKVGPDTESEIEQGQEDTALVGVDANGRPVRERAVELGELGMFGIVTEPVDGAHGPLMVFLNVATEHHIGPGRRWVEMARDWTAHGLRSVRFDLSGVGDSPVHPGQTEAITFAPQWIDDVPAVLAALSPSDPSDAVLIGLCSGGYSAMETGMAVGVRGVYVFNPTVVSASMNKHSEEFDPRRRACRPMPMPLVRLAQNHGRTAHWLWKVYCQVAVGNAPLAVSAEAVRSGLDVFIVCGGEDVVQFRESWYWRRFGERKLRRTGRFDLAVVPSMDHVLLFGEGRRIGSGLLSERLLQRFGTPPDRSAAPGTGPDAAVAPQGSPPATGHGGPPVIDHSGARSAR